MLLRISCSSPRGLANGRQLNPLVGHAHRRFNEEHGLEQRRRDAARVDAGLEPAGFDPPVHLGDVPSDQHGGFFRGDPFS